MLYNYEIKRLKQMYLYKTNNSIIIIENFHYFIKKQTSECVFICSINLNLSGHIFIIEKTFDHGMPKYHIYQTCLNAYTLLDYIEQQEYTEEKSVSIDVFCTNLIKLYKCKTWGAEENLIFTELFSYLPNHLIDQTKENFEFSWSYVIYNCNEL